MINKVGEIITNIPELNLEKTKNDIIQFIQKKVKDSNSEGIIVGLSGGIDSTLVAYLACEALGSDNVLGIIMPSTTTPTDDSILNEYLSLNDLKENNVAIGNLKARIRMTIIYYYANAKNYLVCGTGNKSEILIGYFTKFGDGACDMEPIGELYKKDVYKLSEYLDIPSSIINKPPRAGLWNNQTDEDEIGLDYDTIDDILYLLTEKEFGNNEIADKLNISIDDVNMIIDKVRNSKHKNTIPESPKKTIMG